MSENQSEAGKGLGIASLVLGILALVISFVPCLGMYALFPGIIAIVLGGVAFMQANKAGSSKGLIIAALVISILGTAIAGWQYAVLASATSDLMELAEGFEEVAEELENLDEGQMENLENALEDVATELEISSENLEGALEEVKDAVEAANEANEETPQE